MTSPAPPSAITTPNLWELGADPARLESAAATWRAMAGATESAEQTAVTAARRLIANGSWEGEASEAFHAHRTKVMGDLQEYVRLVTVIANVLDEAAASLRHWQAWLANDLAALSATVPVSTLDKGRLRFAPADQEQTTRVHAAIADAEGLRAQLDDVLTSGEAALRRAERRLAELAGRWRPPPGTIRLLDLNIGQGHGNSPGDLAGTDGAGPDITALAQLIANDGANVATLQEVFGRDMPRLKEELERITGDKWTLHYQEASDKFYASSHEEPGARVPISPLPGVPRIPLPIPGATHTETHIDFSESFGNAVLVREGGPIESSHREGFTKLDDADDGGIFSPGGPEGRTMPKVEIELDND